VILSYENAKYFIMDCGKLRNVTGAEINRTTPPTNLLLKLERPNKMSCEFHSASLEGVAYNEYMNKGREEKREMVEGYDLILI